MGKYLLMPNLMPIRLSLDQMAELFDRDKSTISHHIKNIAQVHKGTVFVESEINDFTKFSLIIPKN